LGSVHFGSQIDSTTIRPIHESSRKN